MAGKLNIIRELIPYINNVTMHINKKKDKARGLFANDVTLLDVRSHYIV